MKRSSVIGLCLSLFAGAWLPAFGGPAVVSAEYAHRKTHCLSNALVQVHIAPEIGGRVVQFRVGQKDFFWVNPKLAVAPPTPSGLSPEGEWLNYGGDKLWPAPQGWNGPETWPGPPDAVIDGLPYVLEILPAKPGEASVKLTSGKDPLTGIQFSRIIRIFNDTTRVQVEASMKNIDAKPRRWGIWAHTQLDASTLNPKKPNERLRAWCPVNPHSRFLKGYDVLFGENQNPSFHTDWRRGLVEADYQYRVGKIAVDSPAGWVATVDGRQGWVFVQRFTFQTNQPYPDNGSVEFWHNGVGRIHAFNRDIDLPKDPKENPFVFESEILSPYCALQPGESQTWSYDWCACNIGGDFPVLQCNEAGVMAAQLQAERDPSHTNQMRIRGRFGVFAPGVAWLRFVNENGHELSQIQLAEQASPLRPLVLDLKVRAPSNVKAVEITIAREGEKPLRLAAAHPRGPAPAGQWPREKAWEWNRKSGWLLGCNFLPSSAVNDVEMWQADTFDTAAIQRELGWARDCGFNTIRVFLNFVVWKADSAGMKKRFEQFLKLADQQQLNVMPVLFDDCNFANRIAAAGKQPPPVPGVHNSQWVSSPPLAMVTNYSAWPELESYAKDMVQTFGHDRRIVAWDLYNEAGNSRMGTNSLPLLKAVFDWARSAHPAQPLTSCAWIDFKSPMSQRIMELSDVVSFHGYLPLSGTLDMLEACRKFDRPIICTEWLHRARGNTVEEILPVFHSQGVGCYNWGLVSGRTQTYMPWGSAPGTPVPTLWQHDLLHSDGRPFKPEERNLIRQHSQKK